ncbi:DUF1460 domain-containing protein, partial [Myxococcota bacterium]|nr:DUF1460 domain-containing protein [Myxococcota bacterium]
QKTFSFMSTHPDLYPQLSDPEILRKIKIKEEELSKKGISVIRKVDSAAIEKELQDGDILAIVSSKPGILVAHTALVKVNQNGERRVLHASHHHNRVLLTRATVSEYLKARPERIGVLIARPLPPEKQESTIGL